MYGKKLSSIKCSLTFFGFEEKIEGIEMEKT